MRIAADGYYHKLDSFFKELYTNGHITDEEYGNYKKNKWKMLIIQLLPFIFMLIVLLVGAIIYYTGYSYKGETSENTALFLITMGVVVMIMALFYTLPLGFITKSGRRMADIRQLYKEDILFDSNSLPTVKGIINGEMDRPISFKEWRATIVLFLLPILIVGLSSIDVIQQRHERVKYEKILEQKPQVNKSTGTGDLAAVMDTLKNDFAKEDVYYYIAGEKDYSETDLFLIVILADENKDEVYMAHFPVKDERSYSLDYFIYKSDAISVEQVKKKADGKL